MIQLPIIDFSDIKDQFFLTQKGDTVYAYCDNNVMLFGSAEELIEKFREMDLRKETKEVYSLENGKTIPKVRNSFLSTMQIKCVK